jgi:hypothetical protein
LTSRIGCAEPACFPKDDPLNPVRIELSLKNVVIADILYDTREHYHHYSGISGHHDPPNHGRPTCLQEAAMRILIFLLLPATLLLSGCALASSDPSLVSPPENGDTVMQVTGKIAFITIEGGFYGIVGDDGAQFDPLNLPEEFRRDGLAICATLRPVEGVVTFRMWGTIVEIVSIEKIH